MTEDKNLVDVSEVSSCVTGWHNSQWCPLYSIGCGGFVPLDTAEDGLRVIKRLIKQEEESTYEDSDERYDELIEIKYDLEMILLRHYSKFPETEEV
jgi:hypothetical protein